MFNIKGSIYQVNSLRIEYNVIDLQTNFKVAV